MVEPDFNALKNNIIDVIKEGQIKLGYKSETISLYYPMESINDLLGVEYAINDLNDALERFCIYVKSQLGDVKYTIRDTRYCIVIPPDGVTYVHQEIEDRYFIREFIEAIKKHKCSLEDITEVFLRYSNCIICKKITTGEFDYLIYFDDEQPDAYMYCIKFEENHAIYDRFTKADYNKFHF